MVRVLSSSETWEIDSPLILKSNYPGKQKGSLAEPEHSIFWDSAAALNHSFPNPNLEEVPFRFLPQWFTVMPQTQDQWPEGVASS